MNSKLCGGKFYKALFNLIRKNLFQIDDMVSGLVVAQLLFLQSENSKKPVHIYINSPGKN